MGRLEKRRNRKKPVQAKGNITPQQDSSKLQITETSVEYSSGPLPPAKEFEEYEKICPGAAGIILQGYKEQYSHRMKMESKAMNWQIVDGVLGKIFGLVLVSGMVVGAVMMGLAGETKVAVALVTGPLAGVVINFIHGKKKKSVSNGNNHPPKSGRTPPTS